MTNKERQLFLAKVNELLLSLGATQHGDDFILQTKTGKLTLFPTPNETIGLGTVFGRFDDPKAALKLVPCNPYSGKWNHHFFDEWTVESAMAELEFQLRKVIS
jgi:hypothetical protein